MKTLSIDIETYSKVDLKKCGVYVYASDYSFAVLLFGYCVDDGPVQVVDLASGEALPPDVLSALTDPTVEKHAFNATFERICLSRWMGMPVGTYLDPSSWYCTMVLASVQGLRGSLKAVSSALNLDTQKLVEGDELIKYFCCSQIPTPSNGYRDRYHPVDDPQSWELFKAYNIRDVEVENSIRKRLPPISQALHDEYVEDQRINDRGVGVDSELVRKACIFVDTELSELTQKITAITGVSNPRSLVQMKDWFSRNGCELEQLNTESIQNALLHEHTPDVQEVLKLTLERSKTTVKKYESMKSCTCLDGRLRGLLQFFGGITGRFSSHHVQLQNLPRINLSNDELDRARNLLRSADYATVKAEFPNVLDTLSQLERTMLVPAKGMRFIVADYSSIEPRVLAWLTSETWRMDVFASGQDLYCASASKMFHVPVEKNGINGHLRQKGKVAELALGYGGGTEALKRMGAVKAGIDENELSRIVKSWRDANPNIVRFWKKIDIAVRATLLCNKDEVRSLQGNDKLKFVVDDERTLFIILPSGRRLTYRNMKFVQKESWSQFSFKDCDGERTTWGAKLVENIVQAVARDILCNAIKNLADTRIVMHVHDELIIEAPEDLSVEQVISAMTQVPEWAEGLLLNAEGDAVPYYKKL